jgi:hypothetical protein
MHKLTPILVFAAFFVFALGMVRFATYHPFERVANGIELIDSANAVTRNNAVPIASHSDVTGTVQTYLPYIARSYAGDEFTHLWQGEITGQLPNCGLTRVFGYTLDQDGGLAGDVWVHVWADGWDGLWAKSLWIDYGGGTPWIGDDGNWDATIDTHPRSGVWHVCIVPGQATWDCLSNLVEAVTSADCQNGVQVVQITFRRY